MSRSGRSAFAVGAFVWLLMQGCNLIAPLEDVRASTPTSIASDARDAGSSTHGGVMTPQNSPMTNAAKSGSAASDEAASTPMLDENEQEEADDAGTKSEVCAQQGTVAACNPFKRCGCKADERCALDDDETAVRCVTESGGTRGRGEPCQRSSECAVGLECPRTRLCSPYCAADSDCQGGERCLPHESEDADRIVAGASACLRVCDPVSGASCPNDTRCQATVDARKVQFAVCVSNSQMDLHTLGESCEDDPNACVSKLGCARYGRNVCTPLCRADGDCPADLPRCYFVDRLAAPNERIGDCWYDPCDDSKIPEPPAWQAPPVANASTLEACQRACGPRLSTDLECVAMSCSPDLARCIDQEQIACAAARGGPCRALYVAASCNDYEERRTHHVQFEACLEMRSECADQAQLTCSGEKS